MVLLTQKEVAERAAAQPGDMSVLAVSAQLYADVTLGIDVPAMYFTPPPKVDSRVLILRTKQPHLPDGVSEKQFFRVVKAGFSARRKKLRSSLSGGLAMSKPQVEELLARAGVSANARAEDLSVAAWCRVAACVYQTPPAL